jgi:hypothetical protein
MAKGSNTWIWWTIGGISLLGLGVGAYIFFKDRKEKNAQAGSETDASPSPSNAPSSSSSSSGSSSNNTPFKNRTEGNAFRAWVNDNHSDYARSIDLDRTGPFNNPTIQKAWKQYGSAYSNRGATTQSTPANTTRTLQSIANDLRDGGLVQDVQIDTKNNRVRGFAYDGFGFGSNNIYVNLYLDGTLYFEDGNDSRKKSGTFSGTSPNMTMEVQGARVTGRGGIIANELGKSLYASFGFDYIADVDNIMNNSKIGFMDINDANL